MLYMVNFLLPTVENWFNTIYRGRTWVCDEPRQGATKATTTEDNVTKVHDEVFQLKQ